MGVHYINAVFPGHAVLVVRRAASDLHCVFRPASEGAGGFRRGPYMSSSSSGPPAAAGQSQASILAYACQHTCRDGDDWGDGDERDCWTLPVE